MSTRLESAYFSVTQAFIYKKDKECIGFIAYRRQVPASLKRVQTGTVEYVRYTPDPVNPELLKRQAIEIPVYQEVIDGYTFKTCWDMEVPQNATDREIFMAILKTDKLRLGQKLGILAYYFSDIGLKIFSIAFLIIALSGIGITIYFLIIVFLRILNYIF